MRVRAAQEHVLRRVKVAVQFLRRGVDLIWGDSTQAGN
jgi:hypothetical protein